jgi:hypothetical protein
MGIPFYDMALIRNFISNLIKIYEEEKGKVELKELVKKLYQVDPQNRERICNSGLNASELEEITMEVMKYILNLEEGKETMVNLIASTLLKNC